jgi:hypothetical protein
LPSSSMDQEETFPALPYRGPPQDHQQPTDLGPSGSHTNSLPRSITAPPQTHAPEISLRFPEKQGSSGHNSRDVLPLDQRENPYDAASSALHGPRPISRRRTTDMHPSRGLDWIIPQDVTEKRSFRRAATVGERLQPTIDIARQERDKFSKKGGFSESCSAYKY